MFQKLSARVDNLYYKVAVEKVKSMYSTCDSNDAWDPSNVEIHQKCTKEISNSSPEINNNIKAIESYSVNRNGTTSILAEFNQILSDVKFERNPSKAFYQVIHFIRNEFMPLTQTLSCFEIEGCLETKMEVVMRLKMIQWGLYGLDEVSTGLFVANHFTMLGPYFGDLGGTNWPHVPLHKEPTTLEKDFNQLLTDITFVMSNETLNNVSILDLPAFGSSVGTLRKDLKKHFNWPVETNHAILTNNSTLNLTHMFTEYKTLVEDWGQHMAKLGKKGDVSHFTQEMKSNTILNFTNVIDANMKTFLIALSGT